jgi:hypothetical protein
VIYRSTSDAWTLTFSAPSGQPLTPGTYTVPAYGVSLDTPRMSVSRAFCSSGADGSFTVHEVTNADAYDARSPTVSISFEQHCGKDSGWLRGTLNFRAGDSTPSADWMIERLPPVNPNAELQTAIAIENRHHRTAARAFQADVTRLRPAFIMRIDSGINRLAGALGSYHAAVSQATPTLARLKTTRRVVLRRLEREARALDAFAKAVNKGFNRRTKRARDRVLRELDRAP